MYLLIHASFPVWRQNERDGVSNRWRLDCFLNRLIKDNTKAPRHWHLRGKFTGDRWIPRTKGLQRGKCFHLMTSSWINVLKQDPGDISKKLINDGVIFWLKLILCFVLLCFPKAFFNQKDEYSELSFCHWNVSEISRRKAWFVVTTGVLI